MTRITRDRRMWCGVVSSAVLTSLLTVALCAAVPTQNDKPDQPAQPAATSTAQSRTSTLLASPFIPASCH